MSDDNILLLFALFIIWLLIKGPGPTPLVTSTISYGAMGPVSPSNQGGSATAKQQATGYIWDSGGALKWMDATPGNLNTPLSGF